MCAHILQWPIGNAQLIFGVYLKDVDTSCKTMTFVNRYSFLYNIYLLEHCLYSAIVAAHKILIVGSLHAQL